MTVTDTFVKIGNIMKRLKDGELTPKGAQKELLTIATDNSSINFAVPSLDELTEVYATAAAPTVDYEASYESSWC